MMLIVFSDQITTAGQLCLEVTLVLYSSVWLVGSHRCKLINNSGDNVQIEIESSALSQA